MQIGNKEIGTGNPTYIIAEIGINHNGDLEIAKQLIDTAVTAGCDAVKFQKRNPDVCVPEDQKTVKRDTPWGKMTYLDYRYQVEFGKSEYDAIDTYCQQKQIDWFASSWDKDSVAFIEQFNPPCHKIPSAMITDYMLLKAFGGTERPLIMSTGMSTMGEVQHTVKQLGQGNLALLHCNSQYPCPTAALNLNVITTFRETFQCPIGYSGHEVEIYPTMLAVALGACIVERHITLDKALWGSDQSCSLEADELKELCRQIRRIEGVLGDGIKRLHPGERQALKKLRRINP